MSKKQFLFFGELLVISIITTHTLSIIVREKRSWNCFTYLRSHSNVVFFFREFPSVKDWHQLQCTLNNRGPLQNASIALSQVRPSEFLCSYETHCFALCMCCDFFACDCRMKCSEGCDCFHDQTWSSNIIECGRRGHARYLLFSKIGYIYYLSKLLVIVRKSKCFYK